MKRLGPLIGEGGAVIARPSVLAIAESADLVLIIRPRMDVKSFLSLLTLHSEERAISL
jgi:hypothetical protein